MAAVVYKKVGIPVPLSAGEPGDFSKGLWVWLSGSLSLEVGQTVVLVESLSVGTTTAPTMTTAPVMGVISYVIKSLECGTLPGSSGDPGWHVLLLPEDLFHESLPSRFEHDWPL
jgi:hypothetical protein